MLRIFVTCLLITGTLTAADDLDTFQLKAPTGWGGETIELPPGFARDMKLKGSEHIRFAPGMMKAGSPTFFSYAFVFELETTPRLTEVIVKDEFLKYYRGLCKAVLGGNGADVDQSKFTLELQRVKTDVDVADPPTQYTGVLDWVEPFATKQPQQLNLEIRTWAKQKRNYIFACVSPQSRDAQIWQQLHQIRDDYLKKEIE